MVALDVRAVLDTSFARLPSGHVFIHVLARKWAPGTLLPIGAPAPSQPSLTMSSNSLAKAATSGNRLPLGNVRGNHDCDNDSSLG